MGKELELQKACQNSDTVNVKKLLHKHYKPIQKKEKSGRLGAFGSRKTLNVNFQDEHGRTCLHFASTVGDVGMLEDLLLCSADPTIKEGRGQSALHYATMHNKTPGVVDLLVKFGAPVTLQDIHHNNPMHLAAMFGNINAVRELVRYKVDINAVNSKGFTPMDVCCLYGHTKIAGVLLQSHSNDILTMGTVAARHDNTCTTPLHLAARKGHTATCLLLLSHGLNVNRESTCGTALHEAVLHGRLEVTQLLCEHGADVTIKNVHGQTPIDVAQKLSAAHCADKLAAILAKFCGQEAMVGQAMEDCSAEQLADLDVLCGELVHILCKNTDGRWRAFIIRGQTQKAGYIPWYKLELLSAQCKPATYMRASSQVLSERDLSQFSSLHSLTSDYPAIPGNERPHSVSVNGVCVNEPTARLLFNPESILSYEDAQALTYEWLNNIGLGQYLSPLLECGYDSPVLLVGITEAELNHIGITDPAHKKLLLKAASCLHEEIYTLKAGPDSLDDWLLALGLGTYGALFAGSSYEYLEEVVDLSPTMLVKLGITKPGHRTKMRAGQEGLRDWLADHPPPPRPAKCQPRKPARSISKNSNFSYQSSYDATRSVSPPVSAGIRLQDDPICSSYWETYRTSPPATPHTPPQTYRTSSTHTPVSHTSEHVSHTPDHVSHTPDHVSHTPDHVSHTPDHVFLLQSTELHAEDASQAEENTNPFDSSLESQVASTNPFDSDSDEEELARELTKQVKPKRSGAPSADGLSTLQRERVYTLERTASQSPSEAMLLSATKHLASSRSPPLSPGEAHWNSEDILGGDVMSGSSDLKNVSYAASNTSSDNIRVIKRGSSEHLDPISPPPKDEDEDEERLQDAVDLIREASPPNGEVKRNSYHNPSPPSPKGYYESDIFLISSEKEKENIAQVNPTKPMRRAMTTGSAVFSTPTAGATAVLDTDKMDDICRTCKLKEDPELQEHKKIFLEKLEKRMSTSDAMKNINWASMSPEVAAVVKSVYSDDTEDIRTQSKKIPPPVAPKPKYSLKKANTVASIGVTTPTHSPDKLTNGQPKSCEAPDILSTPSKTEVLFTSTPIKTDSIESTEKSPQQHDVKQKSSNSVFDDLENMFDEFSKELDSFLT